MNSIHDQSWLNVASDQCWGSSTGPRCETFLGNWSASKKSSRTSQKRLEGSANRARNLERCNAWNPRVLERAGALPKPCRKGSGRPLAPSPPNWHVLLSRSTGPISEQWSIDPLQELFVGDRVSKLECTMRVVYIYIYV